MLSLLALSAHASTITVSADALSYDSSQDQLVVKTDTAASKDDCNAVIVIDDAESAGLSFSLLAGACARQDGALVFDTTGDLFMGVTGDAEEGRVSTTGVNKGTSGVRLETDGSTLTATNGSGLFAARGVTDWDSKGAGWLVTDGMSNASLWIDDPLTGSTLHIGTGFTFDIGEDCWYKLAGDTWYRFDLGEDCWYKFDGESWVLIDEDPSEIWEADIGEDCWYRFDIGEDCWYKFSKAGWEKADIGEDCWLTAGSVAATPVTLTPLTDAALKGL